MNAKRITRVMVALGAPLILTAGLATTSALLGSGAAGATSTSASTGTLGLTGGSLDIVSPSSLGWSTTLSGANQNMVDPTQADQVMTVTDASGSAAGWHVTVAATTFTAGTKTLADSGVLQLNGDPTSEATTTRPATACVALTTCTNSTDASSPVVSYPVSVTTAASTPTAVSILSTKAATGMGAIVIGGGATASGGVGWWMNIPASTLAGSYTSTVTVAVVTAP